MHTLPNISINKSNQTTKFCPFFYLSQAHIHVLKVNPQLPGMSSVSRLGSQPARISSKKLKVEATMLLVDMLHEIYLQNEKLKR